MDPRALLAFCQAQTKALLQCLRTMVEIESPTSSPDGISRLARLLAREFARNHGQVNMLRKPRSGPALMGEFWTQKRNQKPILLLGHMDTVWEEGTLKQMPFRIRGKRAYGPGVLDMKSGIVCGLWAIRSLQALGVTPRSPVQFFLNSDEEVSSLTYRSEMLRAARRARAVLVLEPAAEGGALKTARKGVGEFRITARGRSAHAGVNPSAGVNAISELARQLVRIEEFARPFRGLTLSVGTIHGGTRTNVVPEHATASVDVRIARLKDRRLIEQRIRNLKPFYHGTRIEIEGGINRPPMERKVAVKLYREAKLLARQMGFELPEASTGGGSDGNLTAALGIPTLDGLGGVGDGAHARHEHVLIEELPRRAALVASLLATI